MQKRVLIVGGGRVGRHVAAQLSTDQHLVTVIERDEGRCDQLSPAVSRVIEGDGADPEVFATADPAELDVVAALTNDTEVNLAVCEMAHDANPGIRTVLRIARDGEQDHGYRRFVDHVVYPAAAGAEVAAGKIADR